MTTKVYNLITGESFEVSDAPDEAVKINLKRNVCTFESVDDMFNYKFKLDCNISNNKTLLEVTYLLKNKVFKIKTFYLNYYTYYFPITSNRGIFIQMLDDGLGYVYASDV